jgi:hypothetical protein
MERKAVKRFAWSTLGSCALVGAALFLPSAARADENVTFRNETSSTHHVLVLYGGEGKCEDMTERAQLEVAPGESQSVPTGASKACWCSTTAGKIGKCGTYARAKAGSTQRIRR